ncbi:cytosine permease, partial [Arthrobacter deserti]|nr:cytosine permease [Arthrobacter deserti]
LLPATQGPIAVAMHGLDLSWLAGGLTSAAVYAAFGRSIHQRYAGTRLPAAPARSVPAETAVREG